MASYFQTKDNDSDEDMENEEDSEMGLEHKDGDPPNFSCVPFWARRLIWNRLRPWATDPRKKNKGEVNVAEVRQQKREEVRKEMKRQEDVIASVIARKREAEQAVSMMEAKIREILIESSGRIPDMWKDVVNRQAQEIDQLNARILSHQTEISKREDVLSEFRTRELDSSLEYDRTHLQTLFIGAGYKQLKNREEQEEEEEKKKKDPYHVPELKELDVMRRPHEEIIDRLTKDAMGIIKLHEKKSHHQYDLDQVEELQMLVQLKDAREAAMLIDPSAPPPPPPPSSSSSSIRTVPYPHKVIDVAGICQD